MRRILVPLLITYFSLVSLFAQPNGEFEQTGGVAVIPDIHGDPDAMLSALIAAKVINRAGAFVAHQYGIRDIVTLGDYVDRGSFSREVLDLLIALKLNGQSYNVRFSNILGNHDYELILNGPDRWMTAADLISFTGSIDKKTQIAMVNDIISSPEFPYAQFFRECYLMLRIGNLGFTHGGLEPWLSGYKISNLNNLVQEDIGKILDARVTGHAYATDSMLERFYGSKGPMSSRMMASSFPLLKRDAEFVLDSFGLKYLFLGHSIQEQPRIVYDRIYLLDTAMSNGFAFRKTTISAASIAGQDLKILSNIPRLDITSSIRERYKKADLGNREWKKRKVKECAFGNKI